MQSYFMGLLRTKMSELQAEIGKISREVEAANEEQSTFLAYDKRVKELAAELTGDGEEALDTERGAASINDVSTMFAILDPSSLSAFGAD